MTTSELWERIAQQQHKIPGLRVVSSFIPIAPGHKRPCVEVWNGRSKVGYWEDGNNSRITRGLALLVVDLVEAGGLARFERYFNWAAESPTWRGFLHTDGFFTGGSYREDVALLDCLCQTLEGLPEVPRG